jgi:hypothetical protein
VGVGLIPPLIGDVKRKVTVAEIFSFSSGHRQKAAKN